jgi:hypothetical protein
MRYFHFYILLVAAVVAAPFSLIAQDYNYVRYTSRDGLAGNTVFDMCQDKDGFLWFGTNNGLSRFDGERFVNYTVKDGLPDNEVLKVFSDSYGRVWLATFRNEICYYLNGKFYNHKNDSLLSKLKLKSRINSINEYPIGTIWLGGTDEVFRIDSRSKLTQIFPNKERDGRYDMGVGFGPILFGEKFPILLGDSLFYVDTNDKLVFYTKMELKRNKNFHYVKPNNGDTPIIYSKYDAIKGIGSPYMRIGYMLCTVNGAFDIDTVNFKLTNQYLAGKAITSGIVDKEGIYWFSTLGDGVYKLPSKEALTKTVFDATNAGNEVFGIIEYYDKLITAHGGSRMFIWEENRKPNLISFSNYLPQSFNNLSTNRLFAITKNKSGDYFLGFDAFLVKWSANKQEILPAVAVKSFFLESDKILLVATGRGVVRVATETLQPIDTIWTERATSAVKLDSSYFIGTLEGLIQTKPGQKPFNWGENHPSLYRRISALAVHKGSIWVATSDSGIVEIRNGKVARAYSEKDGLNSNIVRTLFPYENYIWVGTNKGICKISIDKPNEISGRYNSLNLLPNDIINAIYTDGKKIYVGSPAGLTYFEEEQLSSLSSCNLFIENIKTENGKYPMDSLVRLGFRSNLFDISYVGISMKSAGDIRYFYRLKGLEQNWQQTSNYGINYSSIPSGRYTFQIYAVNKFGVRSDIKEIIILVATPFWKQFWFYLLMIAVFGVIIWQVIKFRSSILRAELEQKNKVQKQLAELEQKALQAQMNPHFIFNCLNSIQQFILVNDSASANRFLNIFASLIRETLENSVVKKINLKREIEYITKYLDLEKMRFGNKFQYRINIGIDIEMVDIPVMLIQPFVENALRHGIRYRNDDEGLVELDFSGDENVLVCIVRDNGVGRAKSMELKSSSHIEYQSRGMELTQRRMEILNHTGEETVDIQIKDLIKENGEASGTEVIITIIQNLVEKK